MADWWDGILTDAGGGTATASGDGGGGNWWDGILTDAKEDPKSTPATLDLTPRQVLENELKAAGEYGSPNVDIDKKIKIQQELDNLNDLAGKLGRDPDRYEQSVDQERRKRNPLTQTLPYRAIESAVSTPFNMAGGIAATVGLGVSTAVGADTMGGAFREARDNIYGGRYRDATAQGFANKDAMIGETLASWIQQASGSIGTAIGAGLAGGPAGLGLMAATYGADEYGSRIHAGESHASALAHGSLEFFGTLLVGKALGAGGAKLAGGLSRAATGETAAVTSKILSSRYPVAAAFGGLSKSSGGEVAEEMITAAGHYITDVASGKEEEFSWSKLTDQMLAVAGPALVGGAASHGALGAAEHTQATKKSVRDVVNKWRKQSAKAEETAAIVEQAREFVEANPGKKVKPTRKEFEKETKIKNTTKEFRDVYVDAIEEYPALAAKRERAEAALEARRQALQQNPREFDQSQEFPSIATKQNEGQPAAAAPEIAEIASEPPGPPEPPAAPPPPPVAPAAPQTAQDRVRQTLIDRGYNVEDPNIAAVIQQVFANGEISAKDAKQFLAIFPPIEEKHRAKPVPPIPEEQREKPPVELDLEDPDGLDVEGGDVESDDGDDSVLGKPAAPEVSQEPEAAAEPEPEDDGDLSFDTEEFEAKAAAKAEAKARAAANKARVEQKKAQAAVNRKGRNDVKELGAANDANGKPKKKVDYVQDPDFLEELKQLAKTDPALVSGAIAEGKARHKVENDQLASLKDQFQIAFGRGRAGEAGRAAQAAARGKDENARKGADLVNDILSQDKYAELAAEAMKVGYGDVSSGILHLQAGGAKQFNPVPVDSFIRESLEAEQEKRLAAQERPPEIPSSPDDNADFFIDPTLPEGPGVQVDEATIQKIFPGSKTERIDDKTIRVTLPNGAYADVVSVKNITLTPEGKARLRERYPHLTDEEWTRAEGFGYHVIVGEDGNRLPIHSLISLSERGAGTDTLRHEGIHWARRLGLFTDKEWDSLVSKYAQGIEGDSNIEEAIADALGRLGPKSKLVNRIREFFRKIVRSLGFKSMDFDVSKLLADPEFWSRTIVGEDKRSRGGNFQLDPEMQRRLQDAASNQQNTRRLANIAIDPDARQHLAELDAAATAAGEPGYEAQAEVHQEADRRLAANAVGERQRIVDIAGRGGQLDSTETVIAMKLWRQEFRAAQDKGDSKLMAEVDKLRDAYRGSKSTQARALAIGRDPLQGKSIYHATPAERRDLIDQELAKPSPALQEKMDRAQDNGNKAELERLKKLHADYLAHIEEYLNKLGTSLSELDKISQDPIATTRLRAAVGAGHATKLDKLYEYWHNAILSGPATQLANITGNAASGIFEFGIQRQLAAISGSLVRELGGKDNQSAYLGEIPHIWRGMARGISEGARNAITAWNQEMPVTRESKFDKPKIAIKGPAGRAIRMMGWRPLTAADEFFNSLFSNLQVGAEAYRTGKLLKLEGTQLSAHIDAEIADRESLSWRLAKVHAAELTFQQQPQGFAKKAKEAGLKAKDLPTGRWFLPFISFPINNASIALRKAPVSGDIAAAKKIYNNWRDGNPIFEGVSNRIAERAVAWGVTVALASTIDDDDPWITGSSKTTPQGYPPNSIRLGDQWYSYARIEPFATTLSMTVDGIHAAKSDSWSMKLSTPGDVVASQIADKTFFKGISDVMILFGMGGTNASKDRFVDRAGSWSAEFGQSFIPNFYQQTAAATREHKDQFRVWGKGEEKWNRIGSRFAQSTELPGVTRSIAYDLWGRPISKGPSPIGPSPATDFVWRLLSPVRSTAMQPTVGDKIIASYNNKHPDKIARFDIASRYFTVNKVEYAMTDAQFEEFQQVSGTIANELVEKLAQAGRFNLSAPTEKDIEKIRALRTRARRVAAKRLRPKWAAQDPVTEEGNPSP